MNSRNANVVNGLYFVAHHLGRYLRFFRHRNDRWCRRQRQPVCPYPELCGHARFERRPIAESVQHPESRPLGLMRRWAVGTRYQKVGRFIEQPRRDGADLFGRLALSKDNFRQAVAERAVMIQLGVA